MKLVMIAKKLFPDRTTFIIADGGAFPDSLVGGPIAAKYGAPILLSNSKFT